MRITPPRFNFIYQIVTPQGRYQPHIDGLRALAVLAVVAFHFFPGRMPGGFIGVDVFFVISGYLITGILHRSLGKHSFGFTLLKFYQHRIRRIFPAVAVVLLTLLIVGWLTLFADEFKALGIHAAAAAGFVENILLWSEAGYFDAEAIQKPLLHFWSLAVEEQFYIFWPFGLWIIMRRRWPLLASITAIIAVSFALNMWTVLNGHADAAFYLPHTRAWELMVGAWLAIAQKQEVRWIQKFPIVQSWLGLAFILLGFAVVRPEHGFPGYWAILPVLGSALIINAGHRGWLNTHIASWRPAVWIGLISYPLYLWHWVLYSMMVKLFGEGADMAVMRERKLVIIALSIALAWLTYRWLETPIRQGKGKTAAVLLCYVAVLGILGMGAWAKQGLANRPASLVNFEAQSYLESAQRLDPPEGCYLKDGTGPIADNWLCALGDENAKQAIIVSGDSHSYSMLPALDKYGKNNNITVLYAGGSGCPLILDIIRTDRQDNGQACYQLTKKIIDYATNHEVSAAILIQRWTWYTTSASTRPDEIAVLKLETPELADKTPYSADIVKLSFGLEKTLKHYSLANIPVIIFKDNPQQADKIESLASSSRFYQDTLTDKFFNLHSISYQEHVKDQLQVNTLIDQLVAKYSNASSINLDSVLCGENICPWVKDSEFLYANDDHLSTYGAMQVYPLVEAHLNQILN